MTVQRTGARMNIASFSDAIECPSCGDKCCRLAQVRIKTIISEPDVIEYWCSQCVELEEYGGKEKQVEMFE